MKEVFFKYDIKIEEEQINKFKKYYDLLIEWNKKINLTTITDYEDVVKKHFLDSSLLLCKYDNDYFKQKRIIDVGTGAGFPGIPLSIFLPNAEFVLVDSLNKRIEFLSVVIEELKLENVRCIHGRAEELGRNENFREQFDFCISRAVASLPLLLEYCSPFIKVGGNLLLYKSRKVYEEIGEAENSLNILNCKETDCIKIADEAEFQRFLLNIEKTDNTPQKYPRRAGKPKKNPL